MSLDEGQINLELLSLCVLLFEKSFHLAYAANHYCYRSALEVVPETLKEESSLR